MNDTDINDGRSNSDFVRSCRVIGNDYDTGLLGLLGELNTLSRDGAIVNPDRNRACIEAAIDELVQPWSQLTECALDEHYETDDHGHCRWCGGRMGDSHKVLHNGPLGWHFCNIDCAKFWAEEFIVPNTEAVLY